jgi:hypothetical protein
MPTLTSLDHSSRRADYLCCQPHKTIAAEQPSGLHFGVSPLPSRICDGCEDTNHFDNSSLSKHHDGGPEVYLPAKHMPQVDHHQILKPIDRIRWPII